MIAIGTPANGRSSPGSIASAAASAPSESTSTKALTTGSSASIRSSAAVVTSRALNSPPRTCAARSPTVMNMRSRIRPGQTSRRADAASKPVSGAWRPRLRPANLPRRMSADVQSGLEGVVAFATEIAEPDRDGGALRYRGVDIEEIVGNVPFEQVWGLLVDGTLRAGPAARRPAPAVRPLGRPARRHPGGARDARPAVGLSVADRHLRRAGARRPRPRLGDGAVVRGAVRARHRPAARAAAGGRQGDVDPGAVPDPLARRGRSRPRQGDRRLLDLGGRARHERLDLHGPGHRLDRRRRRRGAQRRRRRAVGPAARRRAGARPEDARRGRAGRRRRARGSRRRSTAASA